MELTKIINPRFFPIKFFKEKLLILIDPMHCQINFNDINLKQYFEILTLYYKKKINIFYSLISF